MPLKEAAHVPRATYRVQLNPSFTFAHLEEIAPYLAELGLSDCYCSPIFQSAPGSSHGYDVNDYRKINAELGGGEGFFRLSGTLQNLGLGILLDFVPNHMGVQGTFNSWWRDVLECGMYSPYARYFDIQWNGYAGLSDRRVLVPILEDHYGKMLEQGRITLGYEGGFIANYAGLNFPLSPRSYPKVLRPVARDPKCPEKARGVLQELAESFATLPRLIATEHPDAAKERAATIERLKARLTGLLMNDATLVALLKEHLAAINGVAGEPSSFDALDAILEEQHYRFARWKAGVHEINYRRFFAVDSLIGLRMEIPEVFQESHRLLGLLVRDGKVGGLRIDHIDGLWDPKAYLGDLQAIGERGEQPPLYVLVEKILGEREPLPEDWAVHGMTGYEFIRELAGVLVDPKTERAFSTCYATFTGESGEFTEIVYQKKRMILDEMFANAVTNLGSALADAVIEDRRWRDLTRHELITAVRELMASLDVYRTYRRKSDTVSLEDKRRVLSACERAIARNPQADPEPFVFLRELLVGNYPPQSASAEYRERLMGWVMNFQQYTGAVMAKSVEDTAFYTYCRFVALNEVGGAPDVFGGTVDEFHRANAARAEHSPHGMLTTSTHDTKVSEDVRARLYALSELPDDWENWVEEWRRINAPFKTELNGCWGPDAVDEYRLYQILLGVWPLTEGPPDAEFRRRIREHLRKAVNEAKRNTSWLHPNEAYLEACDHFVDRALSEETGQRFLESFSPRAMRLARLGMVNSLTQVVLKTTVPGVPDFYQGNEIWDFSLVDPDNRRAVDFGLRRQLAEEVQRSTPAELLRHWRTGAIKLFATQRLLRFRARQPELFAHSEYRPVSVRGTLRDHVIAFRRNGVGAAALIVVPRLTAKVGTPPIGAIWDDTALELSGQTPWRDVFTDRIFPPGEVLSLRELLAELPFAVLESASPGNGV